MATSEERTLEAAIIADLQALPYITAQSIPVRNWDDQDDARAFPCVMVRVAPRVRIAPNANFYRLPVEVVGCRHRGDDPNQSTLDQLYNEIADWAGGIDAVADFSADGVVMTDGIEDVQDSIHHRGVGFDIFTTIA
jgi:hypothetical protein